MAIQPARCGGFTEARRQIAILQNAGLMFLGSGLTDPDVALAGSLALYGAFDLKYPAALILREHQCGCWSFHCFGVELGSELMRLRR